MFIVFDPKTTKGGGSVTSVKEINEGEQFSSRREHRLSRYFQILLGAKKND